MEDSYLAKIASRFGAAGRQLLRPHRLGTCARATVLLNEAREMMRHGAHVVGDEDSALTRGKMENLRIG
jgi:hypothetical protein